VGTLDRDARSIHGKIVYFGAEGAGKTSNLELLSRKLKREHRGDLKVIEGDGARWEHLPVSLGEVRGWETSLDIWAVPGGDSAEALRAKLLEDADGVAFVADLRHERHPATLAALEELLAHLAAQGRSLDEIALVIQYNHGDSADETALEQLHRRLGLESAVFFDAVAIEGRGVLQTLSALSKQVLAVIRERAESPRPPASPMADPIAAPAPPAAAARKPVVEPADEILDAPLANYEDTALDASIELEAVPLEVTGAGRRWRLEVEPQARSEGGALLLPLQLVDELSGEKLELRLELRLAGSSES
jgi:signal recognition particle receptor subunit beta